MDSKLQEFFFYYYTIFQYSLYLSWHSRWKIYRQGYVIEKIFDTTIFTKQSDENCYFFHIFTLMIHRVTRMHVCPFQIHEMHERCRRVAIIKFFFFFSRCQDYMCTFLNRLFLVFRDQRIVQRYADKCRYKCHYKCHVHVPRTRGNFISFFFRNPQFVTG